jgi:CheY-like chemotaxis protein/signal transduction histidine kinase
MSNQSCILIVDDDKRGREAMEMLLLPENYQLTFAENGEQALQQAIHWMPDLILLDVMMPGMDGFEVCRRLRTHPKLAEVPIIILTALNDRQMRLRGLEVGADDFMTKPFDRVELLARVRTITRLNRYRHLVVERSRFEWVVEQSNDGYLLLRDGDVIQYANSGARYYLGILKESSIQEGFWQRVAKQQYHCEPAAAWENWPNPNVCTNPRYLVRPETNQTPLQWLQVDVLEIPSGNSICQLVQLRDVSEQINLQQQMWTFQTLVSHKLRAPLNGLVGLQILNDKQMDLSSERAHALLAIARESAKRLQVQILDILRYVDSSQLLQLKRIFNLSALPRLVQEIGKELEIEQITVQLDERVANKALFFSSQGMELILRELFTNSKKFHPQQTPTITVRVTPRQAESSQLTLQVIDNGRNLPNKEMAKVWTPYYQSERQFTGEVKGMGLGLAMVARLVWSCGGNCQLWNREDQPGITVELTLPGMPNTEGLERSAETFRATSGLK